MKILFVNRFYHPIPTGTARTLTDLAEDLSQMGVRVSVITSDSGYRDYDERYRRQETCHGVQIYRVAIGRFDPRRIWGWVLNAFYFYPVALIKILRLPKQDLVVFLSDPPLVFLLGPFVRWIKGSSYLCWCLDLYPDVAIGLGILRKGSIAARALDALARWGFRKSDGVVAIGECMADVIKGKGIDDKKISVVHNWADGVRNRPVPPEENWFLEKHNLKDKFVILYSGNMGLAYEFDGALKAMTRFKNHKDILFLFIGEGKQRRTLEEETRGFENVKWLPYQDDKDLAYSLSSGHVHLVTLKAGLEGMLVPGKIYSSLAAGRPVIYVGSKQSEAAHLIESADCGRVVSPGDGDGLIKALTLFYEDRELTQRLGRNGRAYFEKKTERRTVTSRFYQVLRDFASAPLRPSRAKRMLDIGLSGIGLIGSSPLWALFAAMVKLEDGGPVFYRQARVGQGGRNFSALKFRSMVPNAEAETGPVQASYDDPRVTRIGRLLRATAMDELPQLWSIFIGDMSFVGPRALRPAEIEIKTVRSEEIPNFHLRHRVRPGLTGLAQIYAPRDATRRQKLRYDLLYVRARSFWLDLKLIALSFWITFRGRWEAREKKI